MAVTPRGAYPAVLLAHRGGRRCPSSRAARSWGSAGGGDLDLDEAQAPSATPPWAGKINAASRGGVSDMATIATIQKRGGRMRRRHGVHRAAHLELSQHLALRRDGHALAGQLACPPTPTSCCATRAWPARARRPCPESSAHVPDVPRRSGLRPARGRRARRQCAADERAGRFCRRACSSVSAPPTVRRDRAGRPAFVAVGAVEPAYVTPMHVREQLLSSFIGEGVALPHGTDEPAARQRTALASSSSPTASTGTASCKPASASRPGNEHVGVLAALASMLIDPSGRGARTASDPRRPRLLEDAGEE